MIFIISVKKRDIAQDCKNKAVIKYTPRPRAIAWLIRLTRPTKVAKLSITKKTPKDLYTKSNISTLGILCAFQNILFRFRTIFGRDQEEQKHLQMFYLKNNCSKRINVTSFKFTAQ